MIFDSRQQAGKLLGEELLRRGVPADVVIGLARGGVVVAAEVAKALRLPLDAMVVRKIGAPGNPEFAVGAMAENAVWWDEETVRRLGLTDTWKREQIEAKKKEIEKYRRQIETGDTGRTKNYQSVILIDDGAATGTSMIAAIRAIRAKSEVIRISVALPVSSPDAAERLRKLADDTVILRVDSSLGAVGQFYREFGQVDWDEVRQLLSR